MGNRLLIATANPGKLTEMQRMLGDSFILSGIDRFPWICMPEETGDTFIENASIKAASAAKQAGMPALADDSGLAVDALSGKPGVYSARFGAPEAKDDADRYWLLLALMEAVPEHLRTARFISAVALASPNGLICAFEGKCEGRIAFEPKGLNGFGYDPIFIPHGFGKTYAELDAMLKDSISHRRMAIEAILPSLKEYFQHKV